MKKRPDRRALAFLMIGVTLVLMAASGCLEQGTESRRAAEQLPTATPTPTEIFDTPTPVKPEHLPLSVLLVTHPASDSIRRHIGEFEQQVGKVARIEVASFDEAHQKELLDLGAGTSRYDVMMVLDTWLPELYGSGNILELKKQFQKANVESDHQWVDDIIPNVNKLLGQWQGKQVGVPLVASSLLMMYRSDLFEAEREAFGREMGVELTVPTTWPAFNQVGRFFTRSFNAASPTEYGLAVAAQPGNSALCLFQTMLWGSGGREFGKKWRVRVNEREGLRAMELWGEQANYASPDAPNMYWDDMNRAFKEGQAAMQVQWDLFAAELEADGSPVKGKVGYALVPGEPEPAPVIAGWVLILNKNSYKIPVAWEFMKWATGPDFGWVANQEGAQVPRLSLLTDKDLQEIHPYYGVALQSLEKAQQRTSYVPGGPTLPAQTQYESILGQAANAVFSGQATAQEALDEAAERLGKMLEQIGQR